MNFRGQRDVRIALAHPGAGGGCPKYADRSTLGRELILAAFWEK